MNWYIVQAYSGFEKKVVDAIKDELKKHKLLENLGEILVPTRSRPSRLSSTIKSEGNDVNNELTTLGISNKYKYFI